MEVAIKEKKLEKIIERVVIRVLQRTLKDSDFGLELQSEFEKKLKESITSKEAGLLKDFNEIISSAK